MSAALPDLPEPLFLTVIVIRVAAAALCVTGHQAEWQGARGLLRPAVMERGANSEYSESELAFDSEGGGAGEIAAARSSGVDPKRANQRQC
jgi:hypothetical protein